MPQFVARFIDCCCSRPVDDKKIRPTVIRSLVRVSSEFGIYNNNYCDADVRKTLTILI